MDGLRCIGGLHSAVLNVVLLDEFGSDGVYYEGNFLDKL
jgi:hypothetical protein